MIKLIYYVHGTTLDNINKLCSGWKNVDLSERGINEAKSLSCKSKYKFDILFTSDLKRAIDSANLAFPNIDKMQDKRLRECNYGDFDGLSKSLVKYEEHIDIPFPNGESLKDVELRMKDFLKYLKKNYDGKTIGIIAHRAPQLALDVILNNMNWKEAIENDWRKTGSWQPGWEYKHEEDLDGKKIKKR